MPSFIASGPLWGVIAFLFVVVFLRAQATYWLGRLIAGNYLTKRAHGSWARRLEAWFEGPVPRRGKRALDKYGLIIIPVCFLTVGFQTAVNAAAGVVRMRWIAYTLCMLPGCIAWALIYALGGLSLWALAFELSFENPPIAIAIFGFFIMAITAFVIYRRRGKKD